MIDTMSRKKPKTADGSGDSGADRHRNEILSFRPEPSLADIIRRLANTERRKVSQMLLVLVEEALAARGLYTPPSMD